MGTQDKPRTQVEWVIAPERPPDHFVGREPELKELAQRLTSGESVAVTALQGMGGIGKTALALELSHELIGYFPGGILWSELGQSPDVHGILGRWARAVGEDIADVTDLTARAEIVRTILARRGNMLAVLDNVWEFEYANLLIRQVLPANVVILLTTRDADLARRLGCRVKRIDVLPESDAVALISMILDHPLEGYEAVAREIARLVGCLPLAVRISARLADQQQPDDLLDIVSKLRTKPMLDILRLGRGQHREENVEVSLALSYARLDQQMQWRFRALGAFAPAPFDAAAVADVWGERESKNSIEPAREALHFLARRELLTRQDDGLYSQHDLLRAYALALLEREGEAITTCARHAMHYATLTKLSPDWRETESTFEQVRHGWEHTREHGTAVYDYFEAVKRFLERRRWPEYLEWGRDALKWVRQAGDGKAEGELLSGMGYIHWKEAYYSEALDCLQDGLLKAQENNDWRTRASILNRIGLVYRDQSQWGRALDYFEHSLTICRQIGNKLLEGYVLHNIGMTLFHQSRLNEALKYLRNSFDIFDQFVELPVGIVDQEDMTQAREGKALALNTMGRVHYLMRQFDEAMGLWKRSLVLARDIGDRAGEGRVLIRLGRIHLAHGELDKALGYFNDSLDISREVGHRRAVARALNGIGGVSYLRGQYQEALVHCQQALEFQRGVGDHKQVAIVLASIGRIHLAQGACEQALTHFQDSLKISKEIGDVYGESVALENIGSAYEKMGNASEAESAREQAAAIFKQLGVSSQESVWH